MRECLTTATKVPVKARSSVKKMYIAYVFILPETAIMIIYSLYLLVHKLTFLFYFLVNFNLIVIIIFIVILKYFFTDFQLFQLNCVARMTIISQFFKIL